MIFTMSIVYNEFWGAVWVNVSSMLEPAKIGWLSVFSLPTSYEKCVECRHPAKCKHQLKSPPSLLMSGHLPVLTFPLQGMWTLEILQGKMGVGHSSSEEGHGSCLWVQ